MTFGLNNIGSYNYGGAARSKRKLLSGNNILCTFKIACGAVSARIAVATVNLATESLQSCLVKLPLSIPHTAGPLNLLFQLDVFKLTERSF